MVELEITILRSILWNWDHWLSTEPVIGAKKITVIKQFCLHKGAEISTVVISLKIDNSTYSWITAYAIKPTLSSVCLCLCLHALEKPANITISIQSNKCKIKLSFIHSHQQGHGKTYWLAVLTVTCGRGQGPIGFGMRCDQCDCQMSAVTATIPRRNSAEFLGGRRAVTWPWSYVQPASK